MYLDTISDQEEEELVLTHGDFCLPNIILFSKEPFQSVESFANNCEIGFVDIGQIAMGNRYFCLTDYF